MTFGSLKLMHSRYLYLNIVRPNMEGNVAETNTDCYTDCQSQAFVIKSQNNGEID